MAVHGIKWVRRLGGGVPEVVIYTEGGSSLSFKEGQPLVYDTSEEGVKLAVVATTAFVGFALADASGTDGADIPVLVPTELDLFTATISAAGANSAAAHDLDNVGIIYDWIASTETNNTDKITINESDAGGSDWFQIRDIYIDALEPAGTAGGRMVFSIHPTALVTKIVA